MIVIRLMGGLGNTLFQYALGRSLESQGKEVLFERGILDACSSRTYLLDDFHTKIRFADTVLAPEIMEKGMPFQPAILAIDNCSVNGYWQSEKYFPTIARELRAELLPTYVRARTREKAAEIGEGSVAVHIRRSDSLSARALPYHGLLCETEYYVRAVDYIRARVSAPKFFVFSDDIPWCRANLPFQATFVDHNPMSGVCGADGIVTKGDRGRECEDLWLMSLCSHAIIANSSFSWWGAWLGDDKPNRVVVAPKQWFVAPHMDARDIVPTRWMTL